MDKQNDVATFAAVVLIFAGIMRFFDSLWAFRYKGALPDRLQDSVLGDNLTAYGWLYLATALVLVLAGIGVMQGSAFAKWTGVVAAVILGLSAVTWLPFYPIWSLIYVFIAILVMYSLLAHPSSREAVS
jgi:hypothetical protein